MEVASLRHFLMGLFKIDPPQSAGGGLNIQYSLDNIQSFEGRENSPLYFLHKMHKNNF
jgi:hypothetical protein